MKKEILMTLIMALSAGVGSAADVRMGTDVASAYVFRGTTLNDGFVVQPHAEIGGFPIPEKYGSLAVGVWGNIDIGDYGNTLDDNEFSEIDYYMSYTLPINALDVRVGYTEYTFPSGGSADREISFSIGKDMAGFYPSLTYNYGADGAIESSSYIQAGLEYGTDLSDALSVSVGGTVAYLVADEGENGFNDATASLGLSYTLSENWAINGSITYVAQLDDDVLTDDAYDTEIYGTLGLSCSF